MIPKKRLFEDIKSLCDSGWYDLPKTGAGAAGDLLENILGLKTTNHDGPDAGLWELKFSRGNSLLTLCHKTPRPHGIIKYVINKHGWIGKNGRKGFRHTIEGESDRGFNIAYDSGSIWVRHQDDMAPVPHWTEEDLTNAIVSKLRRLVYVTGTVKSGQVRYETAVAFENIKTPRLMKAIADGLILVDFDAYIKDSGAVRDHGTKFRVRPENLGKLYVKSTKIV